MPDALKRIQCASERAHHLLSLTCVIVDLLVIKVSAPSFQAVIKFIKLLPGGQLLSRFNFNSKTALPLKFVRSPGISSFYCNLFERSANCKRPDVTNLIYTCLNPCDIESPPSVNSRDPRALFVD